MPQLDFFLFSSQCFTGLLFVLGYLYFLKVLFPYISFFVKIEELDILNILRISDELLMDQVALAIVGTSFIIRIIIIKKYIMYFKAKKFRTSIFIY